VVFNERFHAFARYWGVRLVACAHYRARTKGNDERGVGYVKHNAIAGRSLRAGRRWRRPFARRRPRSRAAPSSVG
jgi:transposase